MQEIHTHPAFPSRLEERQFLRQLVKILQQVNRGLRLEEILEDLFDSFSEILPYDRIGFSLVDNKTYSATALWARCRYSDVKLRQGFSAPLKGSSLEKILLTGEPRIITDLKQYLHDHPESEATKLMVEEGIRSSLTCPITRADTPIGFLFFSSRKPEAYRHDHVDAFGWVSQPLALALDKAQLYERLIQLNEEKNLFLGVAAHDLRSPLAQLQTMGELLAAPTVVDSDRREIAAMIVARCQGMLTLLHDMLDLSAIEAGRLPLRLENIRLQTFCQGILGSLVPLARTKHITLKMEGSSQLDAVADPARLSQVLDNLLTNAIKYSPLNSTITLRLSQQPNSWELTVIDEGQGIPQDELPNLFKPFSQASNPTTGGEEKFGLGLAIVKKIVDAHGGEISVHSEAGKGTQFRIRLPLYAKPTR